MILPSSGEKIKYRSFTVKEEKLMLIAKESNDSDQILLSIQQVLNNCLIGKTISDLAVFDIEYLLLMIRGKSVNNMIEFVITDEDTDEDIKLKMNIDDVKIHIVEGHSKEIRLNTDYIMYMRYPGFELFKTLSDEEKIKDPLVYYNAMVESIEKVASEDTVYKFSDFSADEIDKFMEDLDSGVIEKIKTFFDTMPRLRHEVVYKNNLGVEKTFVIEGTDSFFI